MCMVECFAAKQRIGFAQVQGKEAGSHKYECTRVSEVHLQQAEKSPIMRAQERRKEEKLLVQKAQDLALVSNLVEVCSIFCLDPCGFLSHAYLSTVCVVLV